MRKKIKAKKSIQPDPVYQSVLVEKFINHLMWAGKKSVARAVMYASLEALKRAKIDNPVAVFEEAVKNVSPTLEVRSRRVGGANYQVPREVHSERRTTLAIRWIIEAARAKKGARMAEQLSKEFLDASKGEGSAIKKKNDTHRMAEANRAFAHFAW